MSWTVRVRPGDGGALLSEAIDGILTGEGLWGDAGVVAIRNFDAPVVTPPGSGKVLNLYARQSALRVPARGIVQFLIDATPVFWGPAVVTPDTDIPGAGPFDEDRDALERITVVGGEQLLKDTVLGPKLFEVETDVAVIAYGRCLLYAHPALTVAEANFPATGAILNAAYAPTQTLFNSLTTLGETVPGGASFWVDATGAVHFQADT